MAHASALRIGRFHISNEFADWDAVHNTWTAAQALAQALRRAPSPMLARGLYHQALRVYLDRFLNIPAARLPDERPELGGRGRNSRRTALLGLLDREQQVAAAASLANSLLARGEAESFIHVLGHAVLREDAGFHALSDARGGHPTVRRIARAAPTRRAAHAGERDALRRRARSDVARPVSDLPDRGAPAAR